MVRLGNVVCENSKFIMRRSKTSVQLKTNAQKRSGVGGLKSSNFLNHAYTKDDLARRSLHTAQNEIPNRRRSIDCTYHIWKLSDTAEGMKNLKIIDVPLSPKDGFRKTNNIFPPISNKSLRNPRLLSAKSTAKSEKNTPRKPAVQNGFDHPKKPENLNINPNDLMSSKRTNHEDFCHGLPNDTRQSLSDTRPERNEAVFTFGSNKRPEHTGTNRNLHVKLKASSLHSRSSEGSCNSAAFRAKFASRRRLSLPVNSTTPASLLVPGKSREFHKAIKELSRQTDDSNGGMKRSQTVTSIMTLSDKLSTPPSSSTTRDALSSHPISPGIRRDSLQRIEEIPSELHGTPVFTVNEATKEESDVGSGVIPTFRNDVLSVHKDDMIYYNSVDVNTSSGDDSGLKDKSDQQKTSVSNGAMFTRKLSITHGDTIAEMSEMSEDDIPLNEKVGINSTREHNDTSDLEETEDIIPQTTISKVEKFLNNQIIFDEDDESVIDASVLQEQDDDLCDADFREKRIIQWILTAETGDEVEQQVESSISPSPTNGSRETAITVIYSG